MGNYIIHNGMIYSEYELCHYGVRGMKWGVRRFQNKDGSLTAAGKKRADKEKTKLDAKDNEHFRKVVRRFDLSSKRSRKMAGAEIDRRSQAWKRYWDASNGGKISNAKTKALRAEFDKANLDMMNALISDVQVPSGRKPRYVADGVGKSKLVFE